MAISIQELIKQLKGQFSHSSDTPLLDAQVLIAHHVCQPRSWVLAHPEAPLSDAQYEHILQSARRIENGDPLPYILGHWEFYGLDFLITPAVLIPRPETELLVEKAISWLQGHPHMRQVVDVGTGSGCIGIAIARQFPDLKVLLVDSSAQALDVASQNLEKHGLLAGVQTRQSDLLSNVPGNFDLICANLPYIPGSVLEKLRVAKKEPRSALNGGLSGTILIERLITQAKGRLHRGGLMLLEIDPDQADPLMELALTTFPGSVVHVHRDLARRNRCLEIELAYTILHLCQRQAWLKSRSSGEYRVDSLASEGFIHCSLPEQITDVANRYYRDLPDLVMLQVDAHKLTSQIRWEKSEEVYYPHVYGPINLEAVSSVTDVCSGSDGIYRDVYAS